MEQQFRKLIQEVLVKNRQTGRVYDVKNRNNAIHDLVGGSRAMGSPVERARKMSAKSSLTDTQLINRVLKAIRYTPSPSERQYIMSHSFKSQPLKLQANIVMDIIEANMREAASDYRTSIDDGGMFSKSFEKRQKHGRMIRHKQMLQDLYDMIDKEEEYLRTDMKEIYLDYLNGVTLKQRLHETPEEDLVDYFKLNAPKGKIRNGMILHNQFIRYGIRESIVKEADEAPSGPTEAPPTPVDPNGIDLPDIEGGIEDMGVELSSSEKVRFYELIIKAFFLNPETIPYTVEKLPYRVEEGDEDKETVMAIIDSTLDKIRF